MNEVYIVDIDIGANEDNVYASLISMKIIK